MKRMNIVHVVSAAMLASASALAAPPAAPPAAPAVAPPAATREVLLPLEVGAGAPQQIEPVLDNAHVKLATIKLRKGAVLATHSTAMAVTIMALKGNGHAVIDGKKLRLDAGHMLFVAPNAPHSVVPDPGTDLLVLVHHIKPPGSASKHAPDAHDAHDAHGAQPKAGDGHH